jgi:hypothetical protein
MRPTTSLEKTGQLFVEIVIEFPFVIHPILFLFPRLMNLDPVVVVFTYHAFIWISNNRKKIGVSVGVMFGKGGQDIRRRNVPPRTIVEFVILWPNILQPVGEVFTEFPVDIPKVTNAPGYVRSGRDRFDCGSTSLGYVHEFQSLLIMMLSVVTVLLWLLMFLNPQMCCGYLSSNSYLKKEDYSYSHVHQEQDTPCGKVWHNDLIGQGTMLRALLTWSA